MNCRNWKCLFSFAAIQLGLFCMMTGSAFADSFTTTYLAPGVQTPAGITSNYETFNSPTYSGGNLVTTFGGSPVTGTYTGSYTVTPANQYGGAGGTGNYIYAPGASSYTVTLSSGVNYFGAWFSAVDPGNQVQFYNGSTLLYTANASMFPDAQSCPGSPYCGNPNAALMGDSSEPFAYLNFYDTTGTFNKVVISETISNGAFESDNQAAALLPSGTPIVGTSVTPEPATWVYLGTGLLMLIGMGSWRKFGMLQ